MYSFDYYLPTKMLFGPGRLNDLHKEQLPGRKALLVISNGKSTKATGTLDRVTEQLEKAGAGYVLFDKVQPNPTRENVMDGAAMAKAEGCDFVVAVGGGSVMDTSKFIAAMVTNPGDFWDYTFGKTGGRKFFTEKPIPIVCVTTTAGTGSETDCGGVISNEAVDEKCGLGSPLLFPTLSVIDAELMESVPPKFTAYQGMDTFFHAAESLVNVDENPMGEMFALKTIELVAKYLPRAVADGKDKEARAMQALANSFAGFYMLCTNEHTMEHALSAMRPNLPHGAGLIMISRAYYSFIASTHTKDEQLVKAAKAMGAAGASSPDDFLKALDELIGAIGCAELTLSEFGFTAEDMETAAKKVREVTGGWGDPVDITDEDYLKMFREMYK